MQAFLKQSISMALSCLRFVALPITVDGPPAGMTPGTKKRTGRYCIRAVSDMIVNDVVVEGSYVGKSDDLSIVQKTFDACARSIHGSRGKKACTEPEVTFMRWDHTCDDSIRYELRH